MTYYVYQIFNTSNGKIYIGKTNDFNSRIVSESTKLKTSKSVAALNQVGDRNPNAALTNEQADMIRDMYATGNYSQKQLGILFNVHNTTISLIVNNKRYAK